MRFMRTELTSYPLLSSAHVTVSSRLCNLWTHELWVQGVELLCHISFMLLSVVLVLLLNIYYMYCISSTVFYVRLCGVNWTTVPMSALLRHLSDIAIVTKHSGHRDHRQKKTSIAWNKQVRCSIRQSWRFSMAASFWSHRYHRQKNRPWRYKAVRCSIRQR